MQTAAGRRSHGATRSRAAQGRAVRQVHGRGPGTVFISGIEALVRLVLDQRRLDRARGLNTAAFISGYEGSPLGGLDLELQRNRPLLDEAGRRLPPGVNEELAATAVAGTQLLGQLPGRRHDGVAGFWYGKNPGLDRAADAIRHGNLLGHLAARRCRRAGRRRSDVQVLDAPVLVRADGPEPARPAPHPRLGGRRPRPSVCTRWRCPASPAPGSRSRSCRTSPTASADRPAVETRPPSSRRPTSAARCTSRCWSGPSPSTPSERLHAFRLPRVGEYAHHAGLNVVHFEPRRPRLGDRRPGPPLRHRAARARGPRARRRRPRARSACGWSASAWPGRSSRWPCASWSPASTRSLVIEDKTAFVEAQLKEALYRPAPPAGHRRAGPTRSAVRSCPPRGAVDRRDGGPAARPPPRAARAGPPLAPAHRRRASASPCTSRADDESDGAAGPGPVLLLGLPAQHLHPGRRRPAGRARASAATSWWRCDDKGRGHQVGMTQMGGEGAQWIGLAPFTDDRPLLPEPGRRHLLPLRLAGRRGRPSRPSVDLTYKLLFNHAVAMTGGQHPTGRDWTCRRWSTCWRPRGCERSWSPPPDPAAYRRSAARPDRRPSATATSWPTIQRELGQIARRERAHPRRLVRGGGAPPPPARARSRPRVAGSGSTSGSARAAGTASPSRPASRSCPVETEYGRKTAVDQGSLQPRLLVRPGRLPVLRRGPAPPRRPAAAERARRSTRPSPTHGSARRRC